MPDAVSGACIGAGAAVFTAMLGAIVKLSIDRRNGNPGRNSTPSSCAASGTIHSIKQEMDTTHPRLEHAISEFTRSGQERTELLQRIVTILDERLPRRVR